MTAQLKPDRKKEKILTIINLILWWAIYLIVWKFAGLLIAVIVGLLTMFYGVLNYFEGGNYVESLYNKFYDQL
jgi:bacteriorhodopsin